MKNLFIQHEILLVTSANYYQPEFPERNGDPGDPGLSQAEKLEKACWNGLINDLLSRIMEQELFSSGLTPRHTRASREILKIELGSCPVILEKATSIDSVFYLTTVSKN